MFLLTNLLVLITVLCSRDPVNGGFLSTWEMTSWAQKFGDFLIEGVSQWTPCPNGPSLPYELRPFLCVFVARFDRRIFLLFVKKRIRGGRTYAECNSGSLKELSLQL